MISHSLLDCFVVVKFIGLSIQYLYCLLNLDLKYSFFSCSHEKAIKAAGQDLKVSQSLALSVYLNIYHIIHLSMAFAWITINFTTGSGRCSQL